MVHGKGVNVVVGVMVHRVRYDIGGGCGGWGHIVVIVKYLINVYI